MSGFVDGTLFSVILCVFAGIALRYALFYGGSPTTPPRELGTADSDRQAAEWQARTRALQDALEREQEMTRGLRHELAQYATQLQSSRQEWEEQLTAERQRRRDSDQRRQELLEQLEQSSALLAQLHEERDFLERTEYELKATKEQLIQLARESQAQGDLRLAYNTAQDEIQQLQQQHQELQAKRDILQSEIDAARQREADWKRSLEQAEAKRHEIQQEVSRMQQEMVEVYTSLDSLRQRAERADQLEQELQARHKEQQQLRLSQERLLSEREQFAKSHQEFQQEIARRDHQIRNLTTEKEHILEGLHRASARQQELTEALRQEQQRRASLEAQLPEWEQTRAQLQQVQPKLQEAYSRLAEVSQAHDAAQAALAQTQRESAELQSEVQRLAQRLERQECLARELRIDKEEALTYLERERNEKAALERKLRIHTESLDRLKQDAKALESLLERQTAVQSSLHEHAERLRAASLEDAPTHESTDYGCHVSRKSFIVPIGDRITSPRVTGVDDNPLLAQRDSGRTPVLDDWQRILGVTEAQETRLKALGFVRLEQIAQWTEAEIQRVSRTLGFQNCSLAERWVAQAKRLVSDRQIAAA